MHPPTVEAVVLAAQSYPHLMVFDVDAEAAAFRGETVVTWSAAPSIAAGESWAADARRCVQRLPVGGLLAGFVGYEAGRWTEHMPPPRGPRRLPDLVLRPTEGHLSFHHDTKTWHIAGSDAFVAECEHLLHNARNISVPPLPLLPRAHGPQGDEKAYQDAVKEALLGIRDGEYYQVNLAWEAEGAPLRDPMLCWLTLRAANPARRSAWVSVAPSTHLLSNSPETFLDVCSAEGRKVAHSLPIKGTASAAGGDAAFVALRDSVKETAELTMIADLVRNDLGKFAVIGGVKAAPRRIRTCGDLLHAEQAIQATLRPDIDAIDAFVGAFPPGSITGAPKVRAMETIGALEAQPRGAYTGAIGFFAANGDARWNVAIRTITSLPDRCAFHIGAGIVADSRPEAEWHETVAKGRMLQAAVHLFTETP